MSPESCPPGAFRCGSRQGVARQSGRGRWSRRRRARAGAGRAGRAVLIGIPDGPLPIND